MIRVAKVTGSERLRHFRVEREQQTSAEDRGCVEDHAAQAHASDRLSTVRQMANHEGIDQAHRHPPDLCKD